MFSFKIHHRLFLLFAILVFALAIVTAFQVNSKNKVTEDLIQTLYSHGYVSSNLILNADRDMYQSLVAQRTLIFTEKGDKNTEKLDKSYRDNISQAKERVQKAREILEKDRADFEKYRHKDSNKNIYELFTVFENNFNEWIIKSNSLISSVTMLSVNQRKDLTEQLLKEDKKFEDAREGINQIGELLEQIAADSISKNRSIKQKSTYYVLVIDIAAVALAMVFFYFLVRSISDPIKEMQLVAMKIAEGDLSMADTRVRSRDEIGSLGSSINIMKDRLKSIIYKLVDSATQVSESSARINQQVFQTSSAATETAATIGEIAVTVENVANSTQEVAKDAKKATAMAAEGKSGIDRVINQMASISSTTSQVSAVISELAHKTNLITQIVDVITTIADQTNLLALNAAIEAARAGEQGKGFAVVADEVRKLAEQSGKAAGEIRSLITLIQDTSVKAVSAMEAGARDVATGSAIVAETGKVFENIMITVENLSGQIMNVAGAAEQMSTAVQNVAASTEQQTASMEEISSAVEILSGMANELKVISGNFRI